MTTTDDVLDVAWKASRSDKPVLNFQTTLRTTIEQYAAERVAEARKPMTVDALMAAVLDATDQRCAWDAADSEAEAARTLLLWQESMSAVRTAIEQYGKEQYARGVESDKLMTVDALIENTRRAWYLGQRYWQQADSESYADNRRSDLTLEKFNKLLESNRAAIEQYGREREAAGRGSGEPLTDEQIARLFHDTYERLAPSFGYETRADTKAFDPNSPNGRLMIAVCREVAHNIRSAG